MLVVIVNVTKYVPQKYQIWQICCYQVRFLPRDASAERGDEIACRLSVRLSVCNDQVPWPHTLEFLENNFTAE